MLASALLALALAAQPGPPDDGPVRTAPTEAPAADIGLDDKQIDLAPAGAASPAVAEPKAAPAAVAAAKALTIEQRTLVENGTLQVVIGQRALFRLDDKGQPVLDRVEDGQLAEAHPDGAVTETFQPPPEGQIAIALDGSAEKRVTILKVWNETERALDYRAIALVMAQGKVTPAPAPVCAAPPRSIRIETWRRPIVAVGLGRFREAVTTTACK